MSENYTPRRGQKNAPKKHGGLIAALIVIVVVIAAAVIAFPRILPLLQSHPDTGAVSSGVTSSAPAVSTPADVSTPDTSEPVVSEPVSSAPAASEPVDNEPADSTYVVDGVDLAMLVNSTHPLPDGYDIDLTELDNGQKVATVMYSALQQMFNDARAQGIYPVAASGFRTAEKQQSLMDEKVQSFVDKGMSRSDAETEALKWVNAVGCSEHQSGLAVDINADGIHSAGYEVYDWLAQHAWQYGFILRYPEGKTAITHTDYEPWHYRYVGTELAADIHAKGVCLEEYLGKTD